MNIDPISIILRILGAIFGLLIRKIPFFKKRSPTAKAYEKADEAEANQARAEEELADMKREKEHEENMKKSDDDFWQGGDNW